MKPTEDCYEQSCKKVLVAIDLEDLAEIKEIATRNRLPYVAILRSMIKDGLKKIRGAAEND